MKRLTVLVVALYISLCSVGPACATVYSGYYQIIGVGGGVSVFPWDSQSIPAAPNIDVSQEIDVQTRSQDSSNKIYGTASASIHAVGKSFGLDAFANAVADPGAWQPDQFGYSVQTSIDGSDMLKMQVPAYHQKVMAFASWNISGTTAAFGVGKYAASIPATAGFVDYFAASELQLTGSGILPGFDFSNIPTAQGGGAGVYAHAQSSYYSEATIGPATFSLPLVWDSVPVALKFENGIQQPFDFHVLLSASATVKDTDPTDNVHVGASGSATALAEFGHTFSWGGITAVYDADTGEAITDWTLTSASGTDWSTPAPEPSTLVYALSGATLLLFGRKLRTRRARDA